MALTFGDILSSLALSAGQGVRVTADGLSFEAFTPTDEAETMLALTEVTRLLNDIRTELRLQNELLNSPRGLNLNEDLNGLRKEGELGASGDGNRSETQRTQ